MLQACHAYEKAFKLTFFTDEHLFNIDRAK